MARRIFLPILAVVLLAGACSTPDVLLPGNDETDRIVQVVSNAISWPRQESAMGYARAAKDTTAAKDGRLTIVGVEELESESLEEPFARLTFRIHLEGSTSGWIESEPVTACYSAEFGFYGLAGSPDQIRCQEDWVAVDITPAPARGPLADVPDGADRVLRRELLALASVPEPRSFEATLDAALPIAHRALPPQIDVAIDGTDVGVSLRGDDDCLLGARVAGKVEVWSPSHVQLQPGELTCDPGTALALQGQRAPH